MPILAQKAIRAVPSAIIMLTAQQTATQVQQSRSYLSDESYERNSNGGNLRQIFLSHGNKVQEKQQWIIIIFFLSN